MLGTADRSGPTPSGNDFRVQLLCENSWSESIGSMTDRGCLMFIGSVLDYVVSKDYTVYSIQYSRATFQKDKIVYSLYPVAMMKDVVGIFIAYAHMLCV